MLDFASMLPLFAGPMPAFPRGMGGGGYSPNPPGAAYRHHPHRPRPGGAHGLSRRPAGEPEPGLYRASRGGSAGRYAAGAGPGPGADLLIRLGPAAAYRRSEGTGHGDQGRPHPGLRGRPVAPPGGGCDAGERAGFRRRAGQWTDRFRIRPSSSAGPRRPASRPSPRRPSRRRRRDRSSRSSTIPRLFRRCRPGTRQQAVGRAGVLDLYGPVQHLGRAPGEHHLVGCPPGQQRQ